MYLKVFVHAFQRVLEYTTEYLLYNLVGTTAVVLRVARSPALYTAVRLYVYMYKILYIHGIRLLNLVVESESSRMPIQY